MSFRFAAERDPTVERLRLLSMMEPANPFYTPEYVAFRRQHGERALLFLLKDEERILHGCTAFVKSGRLHTSLEVPSRPAVTGSPGSGASETFWSGVHAFCRAEGITGATVGSFASKPAPVPVLASEVMRKQRWEFILTLSEGLSPSGMSKGHAYCLKRARRVGVSLRRTRDEDALARHVELMNASMQRRRQRGEAVDLVQRADGYRGLLSSAAAELFQAVQNDKVLSSNLLLLAPTGAYNHTQGTSPEGMKDGAAHFLIFEGAMSLRAEGKTTFNLGGTDLAGTGLESFKSGFSDNTQRLELETAIFRFRSPLTAALLAAKRLFLG